MKIINVCDFQQIKMRVDKNLMYDSQQSDTTKENPNSYTQFFKGFTKKNYYLTLTPTIVENEG